LLCKVFAEGRRKSQNPKAGDLEFEFSRLQV